MSDSVVEAVRLVVRYRSQDEAVLNDLNLSVAAGDKLAIMGPSGCGKSTLLAHLAGLRMAQAGTVRLFGQALEELGAAALDRLRAQRIGFVFQRACLLPYLSLRENVELAFAASPNRAEQSREIDHLLATLGLARAAGRRAGELSVGEAQRAAVARAIVKSPALLIADEPTGSLDGAGVTDIAELICGDSARTVIVATHDERVAARCSRILQLRGGALEARAP